MNFVINENCNNKIYDFYSNIVDSIKTSTMSFTKTKVKTNKFKVIPIWSRRAKNVISKINCKIIIIIE